MNPELQARVDVWQRKSLDGTITAEEEIEAVAALREARRSAAVVSAKATSRKAAAAAPAPNGDDLLNEMLG